MDTVFSKYYVNGNASAALSGLLVYLLLYYADTAPTMDNSEDLIYWKEYYDIKSVRSLLKCKRNL